MVFDEIRNDGFILIDSPADLQLVPYDTPLDVPIEGSGVIQLSHDGAKITMPPIPDRIINGSDHTIRGYGNVGSNSAYWLNEGNITADVAGQTLILDPYDLEPFEQYDAFENNGTLRVENGGILRFSWGTFDNLDGVIRAEAGSRVELFGYVKGGRLEVAPTGEIHLRGSVKDVTLEGDFLISNGAETHFEGTIVNNGIVRQASTTSWTPAYFYEDAVLTGSGVWEMSDAYWHRRNELAGGFGTDATLTNDTGHTIRGAGNIGARNLAIINKGLIVADGTNDLVFEPRGHNLSADLFNTGTIRAESGATLRFEDGEYDNTGGVIQAFAGSTIRLDRLPMIRGGRIEIAPTAEVRGDGVFRDVTWDGDLTVSNASHFYLEGAFTLEGSLVVEDGGDLTVATDSFSQEGSLLVEYDGDLNITGEFSPGGALDPFGLIIVDGFMESYDEAELLI
ncbi:MAG: hypothetical protein MI741_01155, partial [Rhodospirillales bacterium]|nr:hypothetical protein [Rhodospirillales bacterium]